MARSAPQPKGFHVKLVPDWPLVLRKAWSVRLQLFAAALGAAELAVQLLTPYDPDGWFIAMAVSLNIAATIARIVAQPKLDTARQEAARDAASTPATGP